MEDLVQTPSEQVETPSGHQETSPRSEDHEKIRRWLLDQAERCVIANGSRATFVSDCLFDGAGSIASLLSENASLKKELDALYELHASEKGD